MRKQRSSGAICGCRSRRRSNRRPPRSWLKRADTLTSARRLTGFNRSSPSVPPIHHVAGNRSHKAGRGLEHPDHHRGGRAQRAGGADGRPRRGPDHHRTPTGWLRAVDLLPRPPISRICASPAIRSSWISITRSLAPSRPATRPTRGIRALSDAFPRQYDRIRNHKEIHSCVLRNGTIDFPLLSALRRRSNVLWSTRLLVASLGRALAT